MNRSLCIVILFFWSAVHIVGQDKTCISSNTAFKGGEQLKYIISYNWSIVWADVGEVIFTVEDEKLNEQDVLHVAATGKTYPNWDWFFKVRDKYECWIDPQNVKPYKFKRHVDEGGYRLDLQYIFNWEKKRAFSVDKENNNPLKYDTIPVTDCTYDLLSVIYMARCIDFTDCQINEKIPISLILDKEVFNVYIRYLGKEVKKVKKGGTYNCIKFSAVLVSGEVFSGGEDLVMWVTDDENKMPVWIESPIIVGAVKVRLEGDKGLRNKTTSRIK